jgi:hypothetical protein
MSMHDDFGYIDSSGKRWFNVDGAMKYFIDQILLCAMTFEHQSAEDEDGELYFSQAFLDRVFKDYLESPAEVPDDDEDDDLELLD